MELTEIKEFFTDFENIPQKNKDEFAKFLLGIAMLSSNPDKVADIIFSNKEFENVYKELTEAITKDEKIVDKFGILKRLEDNKEMLSRVHKYYNLKRELAIISEPLGVYGTVIKNCVNGESNFSFLWLMSLLTINKGFGSLPSVKE